MCNRLTNKWKAPLYNDQDTLNILLVMIIEITAKGIITPMTFVTGTLIKMKDMISSIVDLYKEDKKEFWDIIFSITLIIATFYFMFWFFIPTFAYDM